jgi:hypothetical protein
MTVHMVSDIKGDFVSEFIKIGDLNGDGAPDLLFVQMVHATRVITCLTATTIYGDILWQMGAPSVENGRLYSDLPVQVYDWDNDGRNEVLYVRQAVYAEPLVTGGWAVERARRYEGDATMVVLDAATGQEKRRFPIPAPADDCFLFADLTRRGRRQDLVVKDRYWNMWGVAHSGETLWQWNGSTGHCPAIGDIDGDGCDEVFVGFALIDQDGRELFRLDDHGAHQDAATVAQRADGQWLLAFGNGGAHCLLSDGRALWEHPLAEAQHIIAGRFRLDSELQFAVLDRGQPRDPKKRGGERHPATLYLYDADGREIWRRVQPEGSWGAAIVGIHWLSPRDPQQILVYSRGPDQPVAVIDGQGQIVDLLEPPARDEQGRALHCYGTRADVWGDSRDEVILFGCSGARVYANARPFTLPTHYNQTLYPGM